MLECIHELAPPIKQEVKKRANLIKLQPKKPQDFIQAVYLSMHGHPGIPIKKIHFLDCKFLQSLKGNKNPIPIARIFNIKQIQNLNEEDTDTVQPDIPSYY